MTDITIGRGRVISIEPAESPAAAEIVDCNGLFAVPGLVDAHMHVDTTFLVPSELARLLVPRGTTSLIVDTTNVAHTGGKAAVRALMDSFRGLPLRGFAVAPSYTPFNSRLETAAVDLAPGDIDELLGVGCLGIGETVWSKIRHGDAEYLESISMCRKRGRRVSGHGGEITREDEAAFDAYAAAGLQDDHCVAMPEDILPRLRRGLKLFCVECSGRRGQLAPLLRHALDHQLSFQQMCLCLDNITGGDILRFGYLDHLIRIALKEGVSAVDAFRMASLQPAEHYRLGREVGSITPGRRGDILLMKAPDVFPPEKVLVGGKVVAARGELALEISRARFPKFYRESIDLCKVNWDQLILRAPIAQRRTRVRVINVQDGDAFNGEGIEELAVEDGQVVSAPERDLLKIAMIERYGRRGTIGAGFARGFGLKRGAMATSVTIPSNNIAAVGIRDADLRFAAERIGKIQGGFVVVADGGVLAEVPMKIGGIMSEEPFESFLDALEKAETAARDLGCKLVHPMFTLAQTVLSTLPDLGLTDRGLVDVRGAKIVASVMETRT